MIFDRHANLKYKYGNRHFWYRGYFEDTAGANENAIAEYIRHQLDEDIAYGQLSFKEYKMCAKYRILPVMNAIILFSYHFCHI